MCVLLAVKGQLINRIMSHVFHYVVVCIYTMILSWASSIFNLGIKYLGHQVSLTWFSNVTPHFSIDLFLIIFICVYICLFVISYLYVYFG